MSLTVLKINRRRETNECKQKELIADRTNEIITKHYTQVYMTHAKPLVFAPIFIGMGETSITPTSTDPNVAKTESRFLTGDFAKPMCAAGYAETQSKAYNQVPLDQKANAHCRPYDPLTPFSKTDASSSSDKAAAAATANNRYRVLKKYSGLKKLGFKKFYFFRP